MALLNTPCLIRVAPGASVGSIQPLQVVRAASFVGMMPTRFYAAPQDHSREYFSDGSSLVHRFSSNQQEPQDNG